ncbi:MAG: Coenzyme biosynthesis bifunctional protein CoaBC, partial [Pseudomonadota bacterium]|nr:Coenzyme biosynthesis bifunctional protein CoaBC [Pseudomonadota bacterium]
MLQPLAHTRILLGVTGGIAAYKSADLVRRLREAGAEVQVAMTPAATAFVGPLTFQAVSGQPVRTELLDINAEAGMGHIELARWPHLILIAPATADFLARLAHGLANDLLSTLCLATDRPIAVAPAMNRLMWQNPATQDNSRLLARRGVKLWGPGTGEQACGEVGAGRMLEPVELRNLVVELLGAKGGSAELRSEPTHSAAWPLAPHDLQGLTVLLTAGPTREALDPVRFISNRSTGRMGFAVAEAAARAGARVVLVSGPVNLPTPTGVERIDVESALDMHEADMHRVRE